MDIDVTLTKGQFIKLQWLLIIARANSFYKFYFYFIVIPTIFFLLIGLLAQDIRSILFGFIFFLSIVALYTLTLVLRVLSKSNKIIFSKDHYTINADGIISKSSSSEVVSRWKAFIKWKKTTYKYECPNSTGGAYTQIAPFRLAKEPHMGKKDFLSLYWGRAIFCTNKVLEALKARDIKGYEIWPAIIHKTNRPSQIVSQLYVPNVANAGLADEEKVNPETRPGCKTIKYAYHKKGYMHIKREALLEGVDFQETYEWFGSGGVGFKETLVSNRVAKLIIDNKWLGVKLKPIKLI
ncbi:MAG: hypothetical protein ACOWWR_05960 [Eubacteriales bacterium]